MPGLSPKLPIRRNSTDGYQLTQTYQEMVAQNFKNLILTIPGERIMLPDFGVGLKKYLFESKTETTYDDISAAIHQQAEKYMPFIEIEEIEFAYSGTDFGADDPDPNSLIIIIQYNIIPLGVQDALSVATSLEGVEV